VWRNVADLGGAVKRRSRLLLATIGNRSSYCGLVVVVERVVVPPLAGSVSDFAWVSALPAAPCL
jgi:hypothetical protein